MAALPDRQFQLFSRIQFKCLYDHLREAQKDFVFQPESDITQGKVIEITTDAFRNSAYVG